MRTATALGFWTFAVALAASATEQPAAPKSILDLVQQAQELGRAEKWSAAVPLWERVVKANPTRGDYWERLGWSHYSAKDYRKAIPAIQKALELRAGYPATLAYNVACCHARLGQKEDALQWLEKALKMGFRYPRNAHSDSDLESLRGDPKFRELVYLTDVSKMSRDEGWRYDLKMLAREIQRLHYNPYRVVTRDKFEAHVKKLHDDVPKLKDEQIVIGFMKLSCLAGDGHTSIWPGGPREIVPLQLFHFTEGVFVTAAAPEHADLAGAEILKVGDHATADALAAIDPIIPRDNAMGAKVLVMVALTAPRLLYGLGLIPTPDKVPLTIRDATGKVRTVALGPIKVKADVSISQLGAKWVTARKGASRPDPLYLKNRAAPYWFEYLPEHQTVYCQFNSVRNDPKEPFKEFCDRLFKFVNDEKVDRLVLDLRWNGGGNTFLVRPLVHGLVRCDKVNQRGKLFVVIGRNTFSAAQNTTTDIEMHANVTFVGEPTGSSPNFIGETIRITLPYSKMEGSISDLYWQRSWPMDYRTWIAPQLYAPPSFALYRENRDPALEAILEQGGTNKAAQAAKEDAKDLPLVRRVKGQVLTSPETPAVRLKFGKEFKYVGGQAFILYGVARAEQHFFVDADDKGNVKRMYWIQFEGYLPDNTHVYKYKATKTVEIGGLEFIADSAARNVKANPGRPDSDGNRARAFLEGKGYRMASDEVLWQRLVHLVDKEKRNELMIVYMEDLAGMKLTAKDLAPKGPQAAKWEEIAKGLLDRAVKGIELER